MIRQVWLHLLDFRVTYVTGNIRHKCTDKFLVTSKLESKKKIIIYEFKDKHKSDFTYIKKSNISFPYVKEYLLFNLRWGMNSHPKKKVHL